MENLKEIRLSKNLTMRQVAERIGIAECTYCAYEHGKRRVSISVLVSLSKIFDISISELALVLCAQEDKP